MINQTYFNFVDFFFTLSWVDIFTNLFSTLVYLLVGGIVIFFSRSVVRYILTNIDISIISSENLKKVDIEKRSKTLGTLINNIIGVVVWGIILTMVLASWGVNIAPILAGAGVVGLAVGFGAQTLVRDIVNGFFILFENLYNVGDEIEIGGKSGKVMAVNLRSTVLQGKEGDTFIIPNSRVDIIARKK